MAGTKQTVCTASTELLSSGGQCSVGKLDPVPTEIQHVCNYNVDQVKVK